MPKTTRTPGRASRQSHVRFRLSGAHVVATIVATVGASAVAFQSWWLTPLLLIPLVLALGVLRLGTDVDSRGLVARSLLATRRVTWVEVEGFASDGRKVAARIGGGQALVLPTVRPGDLPRLLAAGGRELDDSEQKGDQ